MATANKTTEIVADVAEEVAEQATQIATTTRGLSGRDASLIFSGIVVGAGLGTALGFVISRRILETKYNQIAEDEIAVMREHYQNKMVALENTATKGELEEIVREEGYFDVAPPMAVSPPVAVVEAVEETQIEQEVTEVPVVEEPTAEEVIQNVFEQAAATNHWDYHKELAKRSPVRPYVIHIDEREERPYDEVSLTYYEADDVLCDERDEVIGEPDRDRMIGEANLERFGHGSNSSSVVYIRNDKLEAQYEITRSPNSYAEEVHGFEHADTWRPRRERLLFDDE